MKKVRSEIFMQGRVPVKCAKCDRWRKKILECACDRYYGTTPSEIAQLCETFKKSAKKCSEISKMAETAVFLYNALQNVILGAIWAKLTKCTKMRIFFGFC